MSRTSFEIYSEKFIGKIIREIEVSASKEEMKIFFEDCEEYLLFHHNQDCCESVYIDDIVGDCENFSGQPLILMEERISEDSEPTWTFYEFQCPVESLTVTWRGISNGFYSERVDIDACKI